MARHLVWDQGSVSSNLAFPTINFSVIHINKSSLIIKKNSLVITSCIDDWKQKLTLCENNNKINKW